MKFANDVDKLREDEQTADPDPLLELVRARPVTAADADTPLTVTSSIGGVVVGELIGIGDDGRAPFVTYVRQEAQVVVAARTIIDLHGAHIGRQVVITFEQADPNRPIIVGVLRGSDRPGLELTPGHVELERDGERLIVSAKEQLVLRCGEASITLTSAGKVLIEGRYVCSRSKGVNRIKGGSVQLN